MAPTVAMLELSPVIGLYTDLPIVLESALLSRLQTVRDLHERTVQGQLSGAMN